MNAQDTSRTIHLALLGHGRMGRAIEELAPRRGFQVQLVLMSKSNAEGAGIQPEPFQGVDVCVDFTNSAAVVANVRRAATLGCCLVVGTTGWGEHLEEVREVVTRNGVGMVYAANFSLGVQLFYHIARAAAERLSSFPLFSPYIVETHHRLKKDAPSGTALELAKQVEPLLAGGAVPVSSVRAGYFPGTHEFGFDAEAETIVLRHTARTRQAFAEGALHAARWVVGKKGLFHFSETLENKETL